MTEKLRRFRALESDARAVFLRAAFLLLAISLSLRVRGFRFTQAALLRLLSHPRSGFAGALRDTDQSIIEQKKALIARMVRTAVRYSPTKASCLEQSLALWFLLKRQGMVCKLRIGARKVAGNFEAHAWVECNGQALNDLQEVHRRFAALEPAASCLMEAQ